MLDMGFFDDIMQVVNRLPKDRQTIMFSATMPPKIRQLAKTILNNPVEVKIAISRPPENIMQTAYICHEAQKPAIVRSLFASNDQNKVIIFSGSKLKVKEITKTFRQMGLSVGEMHSDLEQAQREHIMHEFKNNRVNILVATDIVSRGIDIDDISLVINYDVPHDAEDYVHRIGRTARASAKGMSITFVSEEEQYKFKQIEDFLEKEIYKIPMPVELGESPEYAPEKHKYGHKKFSSGKGKFHRKKPNR
jgi:superfamily II DNA/RNA helicase